MSTSTLYETPSSGAPVNAINAASGLALADVQPPFAHAFTVPIGIADPTSPANAALTIPLALRYASVVENFDDTITWDLDVPTGVVAKFDNPPIQFVDGSPFPVDRVSDTRATVAWSNPPGTGRRFSFNYRINVLLYIDDLVVMVSHDPTIHNEPPT